LIAVAPASEDAFKGNMVTGEESVRLIPAAVAGLILIGVASSAGRSIYPDSFASRMEPVRSALLRARGSLDPGAAQRPFMVARVDERFGDNRLVTYVHVVLGSVFLLLAPMQFSARLRRQHPGVHRWTGRVLVVTGLAVAIAGLFFGVFIPFAGAAERVVVGVFGGTVSVDAGATFSLASGLVANSNPITTSNTRITESPLADTRTVIAPMLIVSASHGAASG